MEVSWAVSVCTDAVRATMVARSAAVAAASSEIALAVWVCDWVVSMLFPKWALADVACDSRQSWWASANLILKASQVLESADRRFHSLHSSVKRPVLVMRLMARFVT